MTNLNTFDKYAFCRNPSFAEMTTPALIVIGDLDVSPHLAVRGPDWHADPYRLSFGPKTLLTIYDGEHMFGGISGYDSAETTDGNPERVISTTGTACKRGAGNEESERLCGISRPDEFIRLRVVQAALLERKLRRSQSWPADDDDPLPIVAR